MDRSAGWPAPPIVLGVVVGVMAWARTGAGDPGIARQPMIAGPAATAVLSVGMASAGGGGIAGWLA